MTLDKKNQILIYFSNKIIPFGFSFLFIGMIYLFGDYFVEIIFKQIDKFYFYLNRQLEGKYIRIIFSKNKNYNFLLDNEEELLMKTDNICISEDQAK